MQWTAGNSFSFDFYSFMLTLNPITTTTKKIKLLPAEIKATCLISPLS